MCLVACWVPLYFLSFCWEDEKKLVTGIFAPGNAAWLFGIWGIVGPLGGCGSAHQLSILQCQIKISLACLLKGSAPMASI